MQGQLTSTLLIRSPTLLAMGASQQHDVLQEMYEEVLGSPADLTVKGVVSGFEGSLAVEFSAVLPPDKLLEIFAGSCCGQFSSALDNVMDTTGKMSRQQGDNFRYEAKSKLIHLAFHAKSMTTERVPCLNCWNIERRHACLHLDFEHILMRMSKAHMSITNADESVCIPRLIITALMHCYTAFIGMLCR